MLPLKPRVGKFFVEVPFPPRHRSLAGIIDRLLTLIRHQKEEKPSLAPEGKHIIVLRKKITSPAKCSSYDTRLISTKEKKGNWDDSIGRIANISWSGTKDETEAISW